MSSAVATVDPSVLQQLQGLTVDGGWTIGAHLAKSPDQTGGYFSEGYECTGPKGEQAFFKAINMFKALDAPDMITEVNILTDGVRCEWELLELCQRMDRIISALAFGYIREFQGRKLLIPIPYIIFERADRTLNHLVRASVQPTDDWCLRTLHHVATGMMQLHRKEIAHQDLKLSNALQFESENKIKIADLGRSIRRDRAVHYDQHRWPGDYGYAPPEVPFGFLASEFTVRRFASDLHLLGSFACSLFTRVRLNHLVYDKLPIDLRPRLLGGSYAGTFENALPHLNDAFAQALELIGDHIDLTAPYREELLSFFRHWAHPDPRERGHPRTRALNARGNIYDLERHVSALANMATQAEIHRRRKRR